MAENLISLEEVKKHNATSSMWISIAGKVYDITEFYKSHPGGEEILIDYAGTDATCMFEDIGHSTDARELMKRYYIGRLVK